MIAFPQLSIHFPDKLVFGKDTLPQLANDVIAIKPNTVLLVTIQPLLNKLNLFIDKLKAENIEVLIDTTIAFYLLLMRFSPLQKLGLETINIYRSI